MKKNISVFKFGGASVKNADGIRNVAEIIRQYSHEPLVVIVSASGKTTNQLEEVMKAYFGEGDTAAALDVVRDNHFEMMRALFPEGHEIFDIINDTLVEIDWILEEKPDKPYDYIYDQVVSIGEQLSTRIIAAYLNEQGIATQWFDARDLIRTDDTYREAQIDWEVTEENINRLVSPVLQTGTVALSQGFIGSTADNQTTTLGREGSDFTAAIFSFCLNAIDMTIWKDVPGVLTADPRVFKNVQKLDRLSYKEAIEMTYYGANVIHPKTIKPLQNKNIPLYVKSFIDTGKAGTFIGPDVEDNYPPIVVIEKDQTLLHIATRDFSFVVEHHMAGLFKLFADLRIFVNMMRNTAISFTVCVPTVPDRIEKLIELLEKDYKVTLEENLELLTIRHYEEEVVRNITKGKVILLEERLRNTVQMVTKEIPLMERL